MPTWNDSTIHNSNMGDRERTLRDELTATAGTQNLAQVLSAGSNASGAGISNMADPSNAQDAATKNYVDTHVAGAGGGFSSFAITFSQPGVLATGTGTLRWLCPWTTATIQGSIASVGTAPTGASIICDVKKNGTTIYSTSAHRPTIAAAANAVTTQPAPDVTTLAFLDYITVDIAQVGSTISGADLVLIVAITRTS